MASILRIKAAGKQKSNCLGSWENALPTVKYCLHSTVKRLLVSQWVFSVTVILRMWQKRIWKVRLPQAGCNFELISPSVALFQSSWEPPLKSALRVASVLETREMLSTAKFSNSRKLEPNDTYLKSHFLVYFSQFSIYSLAYQKFKTFFVDHNIYLRGETSVLCWQSCSKTSWKFRRWEK